MGDVGGLGSGVDDLPVNCLSPAALSLLRQVGYMEVCVRNGDQTFLLGRQSNDGISYSGWLTLVDSSNDFRSKDVQYNFGYNAESGDFRCSTCDSLDKLLSGCVIVGHRQPQF